MELFPNPPRGFYGRRWLRVMLRAAHILTVSVLVGGHIFGQPSDHLLPWLYASIATGAVMIAIDLFSSFAVFCEWRGLMILAKILLVASVAVFWDVRVWLLIAAVAIGGIASHASREIRHRVVFLKGRVVPDESRG